MSTPTAELVVEFINRDEVRRIGQTRRGPGTYTIGTAVDANIRLTGNRVGSLQAQLEVRADGAVLINRDAQFPMTLNGEVLLTDRPTELLDGAVFQVHIYRITYHVIQPDSTQSSLDIEAPKPEIERRKTIPPTEPSRRIDYLQPVDSRYSRCEIVGESSRYLRDLPLIYQGEGSEFLGRYLRIFEAIWEPFEQRQSQITMYFDPCTCPAALLAVLEHWLAISFSKHWPESRRRQLLAEAAELYRWRGTMHTLERVIEIYTSIVPTITAHPTEPFVIEIDPHVQIEEAADLETLTMLIELFKPAHIAYSILGREEVETPLSGG